MFSPYRIPPDNHKRKQKFQLQTSMIIHIANMTVKDLKRPQMISKDLN